MKIKKIIWVQLSPKGDIEQFFTSREVFDLEFKNSAILKFFLASGHTIQKAEITYTEKKRKS